MKKKMMNGATEAELLLNCTDMSVLQRQRDHLRSHHRPGFFSNSSTINGGENDGFLTTAGLDLQEIYGETTKESDARLSMSRENITISVTFVSENFKKRKLDNVVTETKVCNEKMMNGGVKLQEEEKSKITEQNESNKSIMKMKNKAKKEEHNFSNDSSKVTKESQKIDYIHVRARRGQATDSHSIAERVTENL